MGAAFTAGFSLGLSLIVAIGAQNAFVLRQGLRGEHVALVCAICAASDAVLIAVGVFGMDWIRDRLPWIEPLMRYGGAGFLLVYAGLKLRSAWRAGHAALTVDGQAASRAPVAPVIAACLAFTWLNPHVYLDTVVLLGSIAVQYAPDHAIFAAGAMSASLVFFVSLGYGARLLRPVFARPAAWRVLDLAIAAILIVLALGLLWPGADAA